MLLKLTLALSIVWCRVFRKFTRFPDSGGLYTEKMSQCFFAMVILVQMRSISSGSYSVSLVTMMSFLTNTVRPPP